MKNRILWVAVIVVAIIAIGGWFTPAGQSAVRSLGGVTNFNSLTLSDDLVVGGTSTFTGATSFTGATTENGLLTTNAGALRSYTNSTTTSTTAYTLKQADFDKYDTILLMPTGGNLTLTFPASSTLTTFLPSAGDMQETCWYNAGSYNITFAAGTGIDLEISTSTYRNLTITAGDSACMKLIRERATTTAFDIGVLMTTFENAD